MHLIAPLVSGVTGAANGTVDIYQRGTSQRATYYTDFEGFTAVTPTAAMTLDANGGFEAYVDELVDVVVKDSSGSTVRSFTAGASSPAVELRSQSFTGTSYDTGAGITTSGASKPTELQTVMDLWKTTNGSIDWKVLVDGAAKSIQAAIAAFSGIFYNVKDPTYGAEGDGATNDASAIQAAIDAANSAGGGIVFFPKGTYQVGSAIVLKTGVSMWGTGPYSSIIETTHATNDVLQGSAVHSPGEYCAINDLMIRASLSASGAMFATSAASGYYYFRNVKFGDGTNETGDLVQDTNGCFLDFERCTWALASATQDGIVATASANTRVSANSCHFYPVTAPSSTIFVDVGDCRITNCFFNCGDATSGTLSCIRTNASAIITGNRFEQTGGATTTAITSNTLTSEEKIVEDNNYFGSSVVRYDLSAASGDELAVILNSRQYIRAHTQSTSPITVDPDQFETIMIEWTGGAAVTINSTSPVVAPQGHRLRVVIHNNNGVGTVLTVTWGTGFKTTSGTIPTIADNDVMAIDFVAVDDDSGTTYWYLAGTPQAVDE